MKNVITVKSVNHLLGLHIKAMEAKDMSDQAIGYEGIRSRMKSGRSIHDIVNNPSRVRPSQERDIVKTERRVKKRTREQEIDRRRQMRERVWIGLGRYFTLAAWILRVTYIIIITVYYFNK